MYNDELYNQKSDFEIFTEDWTEEDWQNYEDKNKAIYRNHPSPEERELGRKNLSKERRAIYDRQKSFERRVGRARGNYFDFRDLGAIIELWKYGRPFHKVFGTLLYIFFLPFILISLVLELVIRFLPFLIVLAGVLVPVYLTLDEIYYDMVSDFGMVNGILIRSKLFDMAEWWARIKLYVSELSFPGDYILLAVIEAACIGISRLCASITGALLELVLSPLYRFSTWFFKYVNHACDY